MSDDGAIIFGALTPGGNVINERRLPRSSIAACKFYIMVPEHYRDDGSCKCDDPEHRQFMIDNWEYEEEDFS